MKNKKNKNKIRRFYSFYLKIQHSIAMVRVNSKPNKRLLAISITTHINMHSHWCKPRITCANTNTHS